MNEERKKAGVVSIPLAFLNVALGMPVYWRVTGAVYDPATDAVRLRVEGEGLPAVRQGVPIPDIGVPTLRTVTVAEWPGASSVLLDGSRNVGNG